MKKFINQNVKYIQKTTNRKKKPQNTKFCHGSHNIVVEF